MKDTFELYNIDYNAPKASICNYSCYTSHIIFQNTVESQKSA